MDQLRGLAERRGGKCLAKSCRSTSQAVWWQCALGHRFKGPGQRVRRGSWCPTCRGTHRGVIERMQRLARERGGECLSERYVGAWAKLRWRCREGHEWSAAPNTVVYGSWCPACSDAAGSNARKPSSQPTRSGGIAKSADVRVRRRISRHKLLASNPSRSRNGAFSVA